MIKQSEVREQVDRVETVLMDGFKHEARTVLSGKLSKEEAGELLEKKYDLETALVIESSVTDAIMQCSSVEQDLVSSPLSLSGSDLF